MQITAGESCIQKKKYSNKQIAHTEGLSIQEGLELIQQENRAQEAHDTVPAELASSTLQPHVQVPPQCSDCNTLGHKRTHCPIHNSNKHLYSNGHSRAITMARSLTEYIN